MNLWQLVFIIDTIKHYNQLLPAICNNEKIKIEKKKQLAAVIVPTQKAGKTVQKSEPVLPNYYLNPIAR